MLDFAGLNWWAILVATLAAFALGALRYGPVFGQSWLKALGRTEADIQPSPQPFVISFFAALLTCIVLAAVMNSLQMAGLPSGLLIGAVTGIGFIATSMASDAAFCGWGMPLFLIQAGYRVAYNILMGGILGVWQ